MFAILPALSMACSNGTSSTSSGSIDDIPAAVGLDQYVTVQHSPVDDITRISSPFGPRLKASDANRYDFHRGIDFPGTAGDSVYAIDDGELYAAYPDGSATYPDGGNVVVISHEVDPFTFQGETVTQMYAVYLHLQDFGAAAQAYLNEGTQSVVAADDVIGTMGQSGDTDFVHLHFEVRLQTSCSLEYQLANPTASCGSYGFDPHVNPIDLFTGDVAEDVTTTLVSADANTVVARVAVGQDRLNFNGIVFTVLDADSDDVVLTQSVLDYDHRTGFDATSTEALDEPQRDDILVEPAAFNEETATETINFTFAVPTSVWNGRTQVRVRATTLTTQGSAAEVSVTVTQ
jgi:murein DD-endopeptidase MepM/ murein hydrolase activator NlpD